MERKTLGVIGGLGPMATAYFMELVTAMTDAPCDQAHLSMLIASAPYIPDRTAHILDSTQEDPTPAMEAVGRSLLSAGAQVLAIPCITAHHFLPRLEASLEVPFVHGVRETVRHLKDHGIEKVGIMATDGTVRSRLLHKALEEEGLCPVVPDEKAQGDVMHLIYHNIKAGFPAEMDRFYRAADSLMRQGAQVSILGCTELSLIKKAHILGPGFIDAMEVLAQQSVLACGAPLKQEYLHLITK
jgi:aspartate racemase